MKALTSKLTVFGMSENKDLKKGAMQRLHPFDPQKTHPTTVQKLSEWQNDANKAQRNTLPPMDPDAKARALHKLGGRTQVRKNESGEREFLLHRGHSEAEGLANDAGDGKSLYYKGDKSSWTPNYAVAKGFASLYGNKDPKISSAWIPESAIHHVPKQLGTIGRSSKPTQIKKQGENSHTYEHEVIVNPGHVLPKAGTGHVEKAKNEAFNHVPTLEERVRTRIGSKKASEESGGVYVPSYMKKSQEFGKLAKEVLAKGAMRRLAPYQPRDPGLADYKKDMGDWQEGMEPGKAMDFRDNMVQPHVYGNRSQLPSEMTRTLHKLSTLTKVRRNASGEREFLLHRGMSHNETQNAKRDPGKITHDQVSSWTPDYNIADSFAHEYNKPGVFGSLADALKHRKRDHSSNIASAWVNEKHIAAMPHQVTGNQGFKHEREVFVAPHTSEAADKSVVKPSPDLNRRINDRISPFKPVKPKLAKAVPTKRVSQAEGQDWGREKAPRKATYDFSKLTDVVTKRLGPGLYHHSGKHKNLTFHALSRGEDPNHRRLAAMAIGNVNGKDFLLDAHRANGADRGKGYVQRLWHEIQQKHPDIGVARTDYERAAMTNWGDHHPDLYHDLITDVPTKHLDSGIAGATIVGKNDTPSAVIKPPLTDKIMEAYQGNVPAKHAHFVDPSFTTSHREAMYHLLANDVFGLGNFVPRTTVFKHPVTGEPTSAMEYVPRSRKYSEVSQLQHRERSGDLHKLAIMDMVMGNNDRHRKNVILDQYGEPKMIDHGLSFDYGNLAKNPIPVYAEHLMGQHTPQKVHEWVQGLNSDKLHDTMVSRGAPEHIATIAAKRLNAVKDWSANNSRKDPVAQGKLGEAYGKTQAYSLGRTDAEMDRDARVAEEPTVIGDKK